MLQTLQTRRLIHKHQLLHHQLNQSSHCTLWHFFSHTISPPISITLFCISGDVYFGFELGTGLFRWYSSISSVWTHNTKLPWNYFCLRYAPTPLIAIFWWPQRITTSIISITICLFLAISSFCWDDSIEVMDSVFDVLDLALRKCLYENSVLRVVLYSYECLTSRLRG